MGEKKWHHEYTIPLIQKTVMMKMMMKGDGIMLNVKNQPLLCFVDQKEGQEVM